MIFANGSDVRIERIVEQNLAGISIEMVAKLFDSGFENSLEIANSSQLLNQWAIHIKLPPLAPASR
jgi:hypothetical protein